MLLVLPPTIVSQMQIMFEEVGGQAVYSLRRAPGGEEEEAAKKMGGTPRKEPKPVYFAAPKPKKCVAFLARVNCPACKV